MIIEVRLLKLLSIRRRIERYYFVDSTWSIKKYLYSKLEIYRVFGLSPLLLYPRNVLWRHLDSHILSFAKKKNLLKSVDQIEVTNASACDFYPNWFDNLETISQKLEEINAVLLIQGSYADGFITNYSDVDLVIFYESISPSLLESKKLLEELLVEIDPIQHHGVFMISKTKLSGYWQMDLPIEVIQRSKCFGKEAKTLNFESILMDRLGPKSAIESTLVVIDNFLEKKFETIGIYAWKLFLSQIMLLPTLVLAAKGQYVYKRDSFALARDYYSAEAWYAMEKATAIRESWIDTSSFDHYTSKRENTCEDITDDDLKVHRFPTISVTDDHRFYSSLKLFRNSTRTIIYD